MSDARGWQTAIEYHEQTKHHFHRSARSLGYLDWKNQPDPFRRFAGAPLRPLLLAAEDPPISYDEVFSDRARALRAPEPVSLASISMLFELSLAISAWKEFGGSRWALRINPSSGNLHPTEAYLLVGPTPGLCEQPGLFHYASNDHILERRAMFSDEAWRGFTRGFPEGAFFVALASIHWREAWKYGERAYRYCQHDAGHAIAAVTISAAVQGWHMRMLTSCGDDDLEKLLGHDREGDFGNAEREHPDCLLLVAPASGHTAPRDDRSGSVGRLVEAAKWFGHANRLSSEHVDWEIIDSTAAACRKPSGFWGGTATDVLAPPLAPTRAPASAARIIRQRRSALDFDGKTSISAETFHVMLDRVLPRFDRAPWMALSPPVCVHLGLFVHRVDGLTPGLYFLVRDPIQKDVLVAATHNSFEWTKPDGAPPHLPLYRLVEGDARQVAGQVSCGQAIAADGAFSLGMIAKYENPLREYGAWFYRRLHWETGMIGQVLYLEAEAAGVRATGIGCFFDDPVHELFGLKGWEYQTLYHFTIGRQVEDLRLMTWPAYSPEVRDRR